MKNTNRRTNKTVAIALCTALILNVSGCSNAKNLKEDVDVTLLPESTVSETTVPETTEESTTATTTAAETSETEESKPDVSETETIETNVSEESVTFVPSEETEKQPTKASKKSSEETVATESKKATVETSAPAVPTAVPATPTPTPEPTPEADPYHPLDIAKLKSIGNAAIRQAIQDACGHHVVSGLTYDGQEGTFTFQFSDSLMTNQQKRADWANDHGVVTHQEIDGTYLPDSESCCSLLCVYEWWRDGRGWVFQGWPKNSEDYQETYLDFYTCIYNSAYMLVTVHGENLSRDDKYIYFGYGFSIIPTEDPLYGMERPLYVMEIYIGAEAVYVWDT